MADAFRALCAELVDAWLKGDDIVGAMNRARAALADESAVPQGKEPASVTGQSRPTVPTIDDVWELCEEHGFHLGIDGANEEESANGLREIIFTALARWGTPNLAETRRSSEDAPTPPADGEVAELTGQLVEAANGAAAMGWDQHAQRILRAAELLQRHVPLPEVGE